MDLRARTVSDLVIDVRATRDELAWAQANGKTAYAEAMRAKLTALLDEMDRRAESAREGARGSETMGPRAMAAVRLCQGGGIDRQEMIEAALNAGLLGEEEAMRLAEYGEDEVKGAILTAAVTREGRAAVNDALHGA